jgi:phosphate transport system permease protein
MTTLIDIPSAGSAPEPEAGDVPRPVRRSLSRADNVFRWSTTLIGAVVLLITASIGGFLGFQLIPTLRDYGLRFFTENQWNPNSRFIGISAALIGTAEVAIIALAISFPLALLTALYITEYAPSWLRGIMVSMVDLMAAIPSILYGVWGYFLIMPHAIYLSRWISQYFGWIPVFHVSGGNPTAPAFNLLAYNQSPFIAAMIVSMMVIPLGCAVMIGVFSLAPLSEREGAYALGSTRWGMIRTVVLPFGRGGIIGGTMLALGRALGETIAVLLILTENFDIKFKPLESGGATISWLIANFFGDATSGQLRALLAAGFVLFAITIVINTLAAIVVNRSRSGAQTEI